MLGDSIQPRSRVKCVDSFSSMELDCNSSFHTGGRIIVAWNPGSFTVSILSVTAQHIHCHVTPMSGMPAFFCTFLYAFNDSKQIESLWSDLRILNTQEAWILCGDFNCVMNTEERICSAVRQSEIVDINACMHCCGMEDIKSSGHFFTWNNKQEGANRVFSKLDRVLANPIWFDSYSAAEVCFLSEGSFDHSPGFLTVYPKNNGGKKPFKYFTMWKSAPKFSEIVKTQWDRPISGSKMFVVVSKLKRVKLALKELNKTGFSDVHAADLKAYHDLLAAQEAMHLHPSDHSLANEELDAIKTYKDKHQIYLDFLRQKAKVEWIKHGDENTALFHQSPLVIDAHSFILNAPYTREEVKNALWSIPGVKAPGPDGFGSFFYRDAWHIVGDDVIAAVLCGRLRQILPDLIQENQGGFVHGRYIVHNIMVIQDLVKQYGRKSVKPSCLMKIDLQKIVMECFTTPMFSFMVNGSMQGFFKSKRGLRQGDPMSPLLFVICMEYLSRILQKMSTLPQFQFHPRCRDIKLTHLCFADDLILCRKGDFPSIYLLLQAFKLFSIASRLSTNIKKSSVYCHGMPESDVARVIAASGFTRSTLPFRYLGVPICSKKITVAQCEMLVDKMTARIKVWSSRNLSYTARMQLINVVLLSIHMYWSQIYVLPKSVLKEITKICRSFLWSGQAYSFKPSYIAWEQTCCDKNQGGLGFRNVEVKDGDWWDFVPTSSSSWYWKKICDTKEQIKQVFTATELCNMPKYSVKMVYNKLIASKPMVPKHRFISWLEIQHRLQTTAKMARIRVSSTSDCLLCGQAPEDHEHLFFKCPYSSRCLTDLKSWLGIQSSLNTLQRGFRQLSNYNSSKHYYKSWNKERIMDNSQVYTPRNAPYSNEEIDVVREQWTKFLQENNYYWHGLRVVYFNKAPTYSQTTIDAVRERWISYVTEYHQPNNDENEDDDNDDLV
ncbi:uncharacterized protein [Spinacia oleracea]|uniref:Reverse transcriptase domain-containing protein n=1 Tax=Spinacia oleracea TaxID=3562 RepID=A0ABM3QXQ5_SPIOL|nr:uncharacterized protein LOC110800927 [Spinacia oleracea]